MQQILLLAESGHQMADIDGNIIPITEWPWFWLRGITYAKIVKSIYERTGMDDEPEEALPPRWMWFHGKKVDEWFKERREDKKNRE